jgi:ABC-2 type transport system permease protein
MYSTLMLKKVLSKQNRALLSELVRTDFKLRYQGSVLGYAWSLLRPLMLFAILYVVFVKFLKVGVGVPHFPVYLLLGIVLWNFFSEMTTQGLGSIVGRGDLIRKIRIPRWIIVVSSSISALINLGLNLVVIAIFMVINEVSLTGMAVWFPVIVAEVYIFALGVSLFLSAAFVKYRDISYIWEVIIQALFYLTPILYPLTLITNHDFQKLLLLNPMAQAIQDARNVLVTKDTLTIAEVYGTSLARLFLLGGVLAVFVLGLLYFKRNAEHFAEDL